MARPWVALLGALALRASALLHSHFGELDLGEVEDSSGRGEGALSFEGVEASREDAPPARGRAAAARPRAPAAARARPRPPVHPRKTAPPPRRAAPKGAAAAPKGAATELEDATVEDTSQQAMLLSLKSVSLVLLGTEGKHMDVLEEGYRPFFQEVIHLQWVSEEDMETAQELAERRHPVVLSRRTEDTDITTDGVTDISIDLASANTAGDAGLSFDTAGDAGLNFDTDGDAGLNFDTDGDAGFNVDTEAASGEAAGLAGKKPDDGEWLDGTPHKDPPWEGAIKDVAGPVTQKGGRVVFGCLKKRRHIYHAVCLPEILKYIAKRHPDSRGVLVTSSEFWFNPADLMGASAGLNLDSLWQLGGAGLMGEHKQKLGTKCWDSFQEISADTVWQWYDPEKDKNWNAAVRLWEARNYKRFKHKRSPQACMGWADAYFLPTSVWAAVQEMLPVLKEVRSEVAVPTMLNYLATYEKHRAYVDDRCWGGCCFKRTSDKSLLSKHVCGSRMDLSDPDMSKTWRDLMFNASVLLLDPADARHKLRRRYEPYLRPYNLDYLPDGSQSVS